MNKKFFNSKSKAFTLVELVIVIAIVIILSVVSAPIYRGYTNNAKMAEGYALLGTILSSQKSYFSQYGNFLRRSNSSSGASWLTNNETILGIDARGNKYFTAFMVCAADAPEWAKFYFRAFALIPSELCDSEAPSGLSLIYNITTGSTLNMYINNPGN